MAETALQRWRDRITRLDRLSPAELAPNDRNWRTHPSEQRDALTAAMERVGWVVPIIVNETTGSILDGHLRAELAVQAGVDSVPVAYVSLTREEEAAALLTLDPVAALAGIDDQRLDELLRDVGSLGPELDTMLADLQVDTDWEPPRLQDASDEETAQHTNEPPAAAFVLGEFRFAVSHEDYTRWATELLSEHTYDEESAIREIRRRLCLHDS